LEGTNPGPDFVRKLKGGGSLESSDGGKGAAGRATPVENGLEGGIAEDCPDMDAGGAAGGIAGELGAVCGGPAKAKIDWAELDAAGRSCGMCACGRGNSAMHWSAGGIGIPLGLAVPETPAPAGPGTCRGEAMAGGGGLGSSDPITANGLEIGAWGTGIGGTPPP
jgi:hypothetical protein